jgi:hypothetical protein
MLRTESAPESACDGKVCKQRLFGVENTSLRCRSSYHEALSEREKRNYVAYLVDLW